MLNSSELEEARSLLKEGKTKAKISHNIDHALKLLESYKEQPSRYEYLKSRWCPLVNDQLEVRSNGIVIPCCMAMEVADSEMNIVKTDIRQIWRKFHKFRKDLKKGIFYPFCYERCNYALPTRQPSRTRIYWDTVNGHTLTSWPRLLFARWRKRRFNQR